MMAKFHERMEEAMRIRNINQTELAKLSGVNRSSICVYLKGDYMPKQTGINALAIALNVSEAWLLGYDVPMERIYNKEDMVPEIVSQAPTPKQQELIDLILSMDDDQVDKIGQIIKLVSNQ